MIGDYITDRGVKMFWPVSSEWVKYMSTIMMGSTLEISIELTLFILLIVTLILTRDYEHFFNTDWRNALLFIPLCTIVLPAMFKYSINIPKALILPNFILLSIIILSFSMSLIQILSTVNKNRIHIP
jgi:hypothetical protein